MQQDTMQLLQSLSEGGGDPKIGFAIAAIFGYCIYRVMAYIGRRKQTESEMELNDSSTVVTEDYGNYKLALVIRTDLKMSKGKAAAQCAHAAVAAYKAAARRPHILQAWEDSGQAKITLKVDSKAHLLEISKNAREKGLLSHVVQDAGRTQIASGSRTVCAVGPGPALEIDKVTGQLKLY